MIEKAIEQHNKNFMLFVDICKAYDSVPRRALWCALEKYEIPEPMLKLVRSLHDGMKAEVTVDGQVAPEFEVCNGLRLGCVLAPVMFNLYINLVIKQWKEKCAEFGVDVLYKCGGKLVGERTRRPCSERVIECSSESACGRSFRRPGDLKRHKCRVEREKSQKGFVQCSRCKRWMRSKGGLGGETC